jgi:hypothetical protein
MRPRASPGYECAQGGGANQPFSPLSEAEAHALLLAMVRKHPTLAGVNRSRWRLEGLRQASQAWLVVRTPSGMWRVLKRLAIHFKQGRHTITSPDLDYDPKLALVEAALAAARQRPGQVVALYLDEHTFYRQPLLGKAYALRGKDQPKARLSYRANRQARVVAGVNALTGQVTYRLASAISVAQLRAFYYQVRAAYPEAESIYVIQDNWPVHFHPDVLVALQPQHLPFPPTLPAHWPTQPRPHLPPDHLPIQIVCLPTYAFWTNPTEKLWRWLNQDVLRLHEWSDAWDQLKINVMAFLDQFTHGSMDLLRYIGLLPD